MGDPKVEHPSLKNTFPVVVYVELVQFSTLIFHPVMSGECVTQVCLCCSSVKNDRARGVCSLMPSSRNTGKERVPTPFFRTSPERRMTGRGAVSLYYSASVHCPRLPRILTSEGAASARFYG